MTFARIAAATLAAALTATPAGAWSRPGHMVTAAIAYDDLKARDPAALAVIAALLAAHPDRGPFQVAGDRSEGDERTLRLMMQCARWPDDTRGTAYDHPTWHYAESATPGAGAPATLPPTSGQALEALRLNLAEASDPTAPTADRALALCWVMHLAGDIHQPLHTSTLFSATYPKGDLGGGSQFMFDPAVKQTVSLHWYWDDKVNKSGEPGAVVTVAKTLEKRYPRGAMGEIKPGAPDDFAGWVGESHALAVESAYPATLKTGMTNDASAPAVPADYAKTVDGIATRRVALAGYRLADLLRVIAAVPVGK